MGEINAEIEVINIESDDDDLEVTAYLGASTNYSTYYASQGMLARLAAYDIIRSELDNFETRGTYGYPQPCPSLYRFKIKSFRHTVSHIIEHTGQDPRRERR
jgi:hypothetical protein